MDLKKEGKEIYIKSNGIKLHTIVIGSGEPLILLHGFPDFWYGWKELIPPLKNDFKLIIPDLRGYNLSSKPENLEDYKVERLIEDVKNIAEELNLGKFNLCGHDWGGIISWIFAEIYPELLNKLIIINAPHPKLFGSKIRKNKDQKKASSYIFKFLEPNGEKYLYENDFQPLKLGLFYTSNKKFSENEKEKYVNAWSQPGAILSGVNYYRANTNFKQFTGKISVPTLVIHGMEDRFIKPIVLEGLQDYVENLIIKKIEKGTHWVIQEKPDEVASQIKLFLKNS